MAVNFPDFIGGSYRATVLQADAERSENWYPETVESAGGKAKASYILRSKPGLAGFASVTANSVRAECALNDRGFAIAQSGASNFFVEVKRDGSTISYGALPGDRRPQMIASQSQVLVLAGGLGFIFTLASSVLTPITDPNFPIGAVKGGFLDGYFVVLEPNSQAFAICALNDGTAWNGLDFGDAEGEPGNIVTFVVDHRQIWFLGNNHGEIYYDSGDANFPLSRLDGAFMEQGASAIDGAFQCDNTIFWLGGNRDGAGIFWRANGYTPQRISTHAIEALVKSWGDTSDASGYAYQEDGHTFARWDFPSANDGNGATLLYDVASGFWHERCFWNASLGIEMADLARSHMFVFGKHLVGDWRSGVIYEQSMQYGTDAGALMRRLRASPDSSNGGKFLTYSEIRLLAQSGVGLDGTGVPVLNISTYGIGGRLYVPAGAASYTLSWEDQYGGGDQLFGNGFIVIAFDGLGGATIRFNGQNTTFTLDRWGLAGGPMLIDNTTQFGLGPGPRSLGSAFVAGQEVVIQLQTNQGANGFAYVNGPAAGNVDNFAHAFLSPGVLGPGSTPTATVYSSVFAMPEGGAPAAGAGGDPQMVLQVSNDGGETWGNERPASIGKIGDFKRLMKWRRTGRSNNRAIRVICSEPIPNLALIGCDVDAH